MTTEETQKQLRAALLYAYAENSHALVVVGRAERLIGVALLRLKEAGQGDGQAPGTP